MDHIRTVNRLAAAKTLNDLEELAVLSEIAGNLIGAAPNVARATALARAWHTAHCRLVGVEDTTTEPERPF